MSRCARLLVPALLLVLAMPTVAQAQFYDTVGVYFDPDYTQNEFNNLTVPHQTTAYLVLHNPTVIDGGLGGWECRVNFENYAPATQWFLNGDTFNFETPPEFVVGMTSPLPVTGPDVLLATFDMFVAETTPFTIQLLPIFQHPSIEDEMAYIPWDDKEALTPMYPVTGQPTVAYYNWVPQCVADSGIIFGEVFVGLEVIDSFTVTNTGGGSLYIAPSISGSEYFWTDPQPFWLGAGQSREIVVYYEPLSLGTHTAYIDLGSACGVANVVGLGTEPQLSWRFDPPEGDFGLVMVGQQATTSVRIFNDGDVPLTFEPSTAPCEGFSTQSQVEIIPVGGSRTVNLYFNPTATGTFDCGFIMGPEMTEPYPTTARAAEASALLAPQESPVDFGYAQPGGSNLRQILITNTSDYTYYLFPTLDDPDGVFRIVDPRLLAFPPGFANFVEVRFEPAAAGDFDAFLGFEATDFALPLQGAAGEADSLVVIAPTNHDFGEVVQLTAVDQTFTVTNDSQWPVDIHPTMEPAGPHFFILSGYEPYTIAPGSYREIVVRCSPQASAVGPIAAVLQLGENLPTAVVEAVAVPPTTDVIVDPTIVQYGTVPVGQSVERTVTVQNNGSSPLATNIFVYPPGSPYTIVSGGDVTQLNPGQRLDIVVDFTPPTAGIWSHQLALGDFHAPVILNGQGSEGEPTCALSTTNLVFPDTDLGSGSMRTLTIFNNGLVPLDIVPTVNCSQFTVTTPPTSIVPGGNLDVQIIFTPTYEGPIICVLELGDEACDIVQLRGNGETTGIPGYDDDLVGIYFDELYQMPLYTDARLGMPFDGYLVMRNPTVTDDISGWEMRMVLTPELFLSGAALTGNGVNYSTLPQFTVGMGTPLPPSEYVLLATLTYLPVADFEVVPISLFPLYTPSIPGEMAYIHGPTHELQALHPVNGDPEVAWVQWWESSVGNDDPEDEPELPYAPQVTQLLPNVPNPFNPETTIHFELATEGHLRIDVYDIMGRRVARLVDGHHGVGTDQVTWHGRDDRGRTLPSGAYYVRLETKEKVDTRKVMLLK